jgi:hypothetical protein
MSDIIDPNASASVDRIGSAMESLKSGNEVEEVNDTGSVVTDQDLTRDVIEGDALDSLFSGGDQETTDEKESDDSQVEAEGAETATLPDTEEISVRGPNGKKRKIKVDYNNRDQILKNARLAAGAHKWQVERDKALGELDKVKDYQEKAQNFDKIAEAFEQGGELAALQAMVGEQGAQTWLENQLQRQEFRKNASEEQLKLLDSQEKADSQTRELEKLRREQEELRQTVAQRQEAAEVAELQSVVNPAFDKYRFSGKLSDESQAQDLDEMVWARGKAQLERYEGEGMKITPEIADKVFRSAANRLRKIVNVESDRKADRKVRKTKETALETAQKQTQRGMSSNDDADKARELMKRGDISGFFKNFGKGMKF